MYETIFCPECRYRYSLCEMKKPSDTEFDLSLFDYFPNEPFEIKQLEKYDRPTISNPKMSHFIKKRFVPAMDSKVDSLDVVFFPLSSLSSNPKTDIHEVFPGSKVGLLMTGKDPMLIDFVKSDDWIDKIKRKNFDFVLSPNLSFYLNQPSCATVYNRLFSYKVISQLAEANIPIIPSMNYLWEDDLKRYATWLNENAFKYVYINAQMIKKASQFNLFSEYVSAITKHVKAKLIAVGVTDLNKISQLNKINKKIIFSNSNIHALSSLKLLWSPTRDYKKADVVNAMYYSDIFRTNLRNYVEKMNKVLDEGQ